MNERIKELAEQAGVTFDSLGASYTYGSLLDFLERFAELVRQDEAKACAEHYVAIMRDAVTQARLAEREACAKLCESIDAEYEGEDVLATWCADAIRARGNT